MAKDIVAIERAEKAVRSLLKRYRTLEWQRPDWMVLATTLLAVGQHLWMDGDRCPTAVTEGTPLHLFVSQGLGFFGIKRKPSTIAAALKNPHVKLGPSRFEDEQVGNPLTEILPAKTTRLLANIMPKSMQ